MKRQEVLDKIWNILISTKDKGYKCTEVAEKVLNELELGVGMLPPKVTKTVSDIDPIGYREVEVHEWES